MSSNGKFTFMATVYFEITPDEAAALLAENEGYGSVPEWLSSHSPIKENTDAHNAGNLKTYLGQYLAAHKIEERRQLTMQA